MTALTYRTVTTRREAHHRSELVRTIPAGVLHVGHDTANGGSPSSWRDVSTLCGLLLLGDEERHDYAGALPLDRVTCPACAAAEAEVSFTHRVSTGRVQLGRGTVKGAGTKYGTTWRCTCGAHGQINVAPSKGGKASAEAAGEAHLDAVYAAECDRQQAEAAAELADPTTEAGAALDRAIAAINAHDAMQAKIRDIAARVGVTEEQVRDILADFGGVEGVRAFFASID